MRKAILFCVGHLLEFLIVVSIVQIFSGLKLSCLEVIFQYWETVPVQYNLVKEEITNLFGSWLKHREASGVPSRLLSILFNVALPRKSAKVTFVEMEYLQLSNFTCLLIRLLMFFPYKLEGRNWWCWRKQGQSGSSCYPYCPLSCQDIEGGDKIGDMMFQKWATNEKLMAPRSGSPVLEWKVYFTRTSVLAEHPGLI